LYFFVEFDLGLFVYVDLINYTYELMYCKESN
jgi:hypothetical protein